jgi:16S rRNA (guanine966-N2)-methyltransferase
MRITGGRARGINLKVPAGDSVRPSTDRMREAVFSSLGPRIEGAKFVDLFAGSGGYGLEALSRGAASGTFVEKNSKIAAILRDNLKNVLHSAGADARSFSVVTTDAFKYTSVEAVNTVFADPPYSLYPSALNSILGQAANLLQGNPESRLILELPAGISLDEIRNWQCQKRLGKGGRNDPSVAILSPISY